MADTWKQALSRQDGVISRAQALRGGMTKHEWDWKLERGIWQRALPGVAIAHSGGTSERELAWAAVLHAGKGAALSGDAGLRLAGLAAADGKDLDVVVPRARNVAGALRTLRVSAALPGERVVRLTGGLMRHDGPEVAELLRAVLA